MKKAISAATSAALLASLLATAVAPSAFAATTTAGVGNVGRGSTTTATATFTFSEETTACIYNALGGAGAPNAPVDLFVQIKPKAPIAGTVQFVGTPTLVAPGSLGGATANIQGTAGVNDTLRIRIYGGDQFNKQQLSVSGLKVKASSGATLGAIQTLFTSSDGNVLAACFLGATTTASGTVSNAIGIGATTVVVAVSSGTFAVTGTGAGPAGKLVFATGESVNITAAPAPVAGLQTLTIAATTVVHPANEAVTQASVPATNTFPFAMTSVGTVTDSVRQDVWLAAGGIAVPAGNTTLPPANVNPGEQNQPTLSTYIYERPGVDATTGSAGFIAKDTVLTFTIGAAGVLFSTSPSVKAWNAVTGGAAVGSTLDGQDANGNAVCTISFDRTSCSIKVTAASTNSLNQTAISLFNIKVDVGATVANGTAVNINVTGVPVAVDYNTVAYVSRVIVGIAAQPTIFINYNDQASGMMSLTEAGAGFFQDASVTLGNNVFAVCATSGETFTRAPWAVVSTGDLKLLSGLVGATSVQGTLFSPSVGATCAYWTVYSASTVASTVDIRGSDSANAVLASGALNGPRYSVGPGLAPGATLVSILVGNKTTVLAGGGLVSKVSNAVRAFKSGVTVTALSQPFIPQGTADTLGGNIQVSETLAGQFKSGETICVVILPRTTNGNRTQDTLLKSANTNDLPIITTNGATGLLVDSVATTGCGSSGLFSNLFGTPATLTNSFSFTVRQQAFGTLGQITISNIHYITTADAPLGAVLVGVAGGGSVDATTGTTGVAFQSIVSNAQIGTAPAAAAVTTSGTALGATKTGPFTIRTKVAKLGKYVTWKFSGGSALVGKTVQIWVATKNSAGKWSAFKPLTARRVDASGNAYFWWKTSSKAWISVRGGYLTTLSVATQARWL